MDKVIQSLKEQIDHHKKVIAEYQEKLETAQEHLKPMIEDMIQFRQDMVDDMQNQIERLENKGRGGVREGAGRPSMGETRKVSITLEESLWKEIDYIADNFNLSKSQIFRYLVENGLDGLVEDLRQQHKGK